jgi:hypothetical protein
MRWIASLLACACLLGAVARVAAAEPGADPFAAALHALAAYGDRSTGTPGNAEAAEFIKNELERLAIGAVASQSFAVPVIRHGLSELAVPERGIRLPLPSFAGNAISPQAIDAPGLAGPLVYVGSGALGGLNGKRIEGAVLLMELDSGRHWLTAAGLGAKALIYVDRGESPRTWFEDKFELSPIHFPRFWMPVEDLRRSFGDFESAADGLVAEEVRLRAEAVWENVVSENVYCLIPGTSAALKKEMLLVEAFYDSTARVAGRSPGADEAVSAATFLQLARYFKENPPERTVLLVATSGHGQALAGLRELVWSFSTRSRDLRDERNDLRRFVKYARLTLRALKDARFGEGDSVAAAPSPAGDAAEEEAAGETPGDLLRAALEERLKTDADLVSRRLMQLRMVEHGRDPKLIQELSAERQLLRRLTWRPNLQGLSEEEQRLLRQVALRARKDQEAALSDARVQLRLIESAYALRHAVQDYEIAAAVSLHLSSRGDGFGAFNQGWLYPLRPRINRVPAYADLEEALQEGARLAESEHSAQGMFKDTLRPSRMRSWQSHFIDRPALGGEAMALAGLHAVTLVTTGDARASFFS